MQPGARATSSRTASVDRGKSVSNARVKVSICRQRRCQDFAKLGLAGLAARWRVIQSVGGRAKAHRANSSHECQSS
jgi:hypothetical protein